MLCGSSCVWIGDNTQEVVASRPFLKNFFNWMGKNAHADSRDHHFDGFGATMLTAALRAVSDFVEANPDLSEFWVQKLRFADTDLSRYANANMRMRQYAEQQYLNVSAEPASVQIGICDLAHALRIWHQQIHSWHGFFVHADATWPPAPGPRVSPGVTADPGAHLDEISQLKRALISNPRIGQADTNSSKTRLALKHYLAKAKLKDPREKLAKAIEGLIDSRLLDSQ